MISEKESADTLKLLHIELGNRHSLFGRIFTHPVTSVILLGMNSSLAPLKFDEIPEAMSAAGFARGNATIHNQCDT
jgi:hypothetical protein